MHIDVNSGGDYVDYNYKWQQPAADRQMCQVRAAARKIPDTYNKQLNNVFCCISFEQISLLSFHKERLRKRQHINSWGEEGTMGDVSLGLGLVRGRFWWGGNPRRANTCWDQLSNVWHLYRGGQGWSWYILPRGLEKTVGHVSSSNTLV